METETRLTKPLFLKVQAMPSRIGQSEADGAGWHTFATPRDWQSMSGQSGGGLPGCLHAPLATALPGCLHAPLATADYRVISPRSPPPVGEE